MNICTQDARSQHVRFPVTRWEMIFEKQPLGVNVIQHINHSARRRSNI